MTLVDATWNGPWGYTLPDGTLLIPGETVRQVPQFQANDDPYWEPVGKIGSNDKAPAGGDK
jgi:hypothetical protein